jgi:hypothetical protein
VCVCVCVCVCLIGSGWGDGTHSDEDSLVLQVHFSDGQFVGERHGEIFSFFLLFDILNTNV